jgi:hypothetical protein
VFERDLAPRPLTGTHAGGLAPVGGGAPGDTASKTGLGEGALTYALFVVDASGHEVPVGTGGHGVRTLPDLAERAKPGTSASLHRPRTETGRTLRHLLRVYRL